MLRHDLRFGGGSGGRPGGMGGFGGGGGGMDIEAKLEEACSRDDAKEKCTEMGNQSMDCDKFDLMMSNLDSTGDDIDSMISSNTRGGRPNIFRKKPPALHVRKFFETLHLPIKYTHEQYIEDLYCNVYIWPICLYLDDS